MVFNRYLKHVCCIICHISTQVYKSIITYIVAYCSMYYDYIVVIMFVDIYYRYTYVHKYMYMYMTTAVTVITTIYN